MSVRIERRDGRITMNEYRAVVIVGTETRCGPWQFTQTSARADVEALLRSLSLPQ